MSDDKDSDLDNLELDEAFELFDETESSLDAFFADSEPESPSTDSLRDEEAVKVFFRFAITPAMSTAVKTMTQQIGLSEKKGIVKEFAREIRYLSAAIKDPANEISAILAVALLHLPFMRQVFSVCFNDRPCNLIDETPPLLTVRSQIHQAVTRKPPGGQDKHCWYEYQEKSSDIPTVDFFPYFTEQFEKALVQNELPEFLRGFLSGMTSADEQYVLMKWWEKNLETLNYDVFLDRSRKLKVALSDVVKGQPQALEALCDGYAQSLLRASSGPRGIFTLMGESGTGKTLLAETFAKELSDIEGQSFRFIRFNMQQFTDERAVAALFGTSHFYSDATLGELTDQVRNYPKTIILFDEIEKAHPDVVQSLLSVLDSGWCQDNASLKWVDFSQTFVLFTTNLGSRRLADRRNASQVLGTLDNATLGSLLQRDPEENRTSGLSPEFVNRLTKGRFLAFEPLQPEKLLGIYTSVWNTRRKDLKTNSITLPECTNALATLQMMKRLPDLSARTAASAAEIDMVECMKSLIEGSSATLQEGSTGDSRLATFQGIEELFQAMLVDGGLNSPARVLLIDDDLETFRLLQAQIDAHVRLDALDEQHEGNLEIARLGGSFDLAMIDLFIENDDSQRKTTDALNRILSIRQAMPETPVIAFCKNPRNHASTQNAINAAKAMSGVSQVVTFNANDPASLVNVVRAQLEQQRNGKLIRGLLRARKRSLFTWRVKENGASITASPTMVRQEPILPPGAEGQMFGLGEIPDLSLSAVVGNERGVRQVSQALGWLKQPGRVRSFGFRPPAGYLLAGPPGTGKTFLARAAAGECGLPFFSINGAELLHPKVGVAEARLRELFANARKLAPAVIFFDEIDAIAATRGSDASHQGLINTLLSEMDGFGGHEAPVLVLAATNFPDMLDPALRRPGRLDEVIICDLPNAPAREHLLIKAAKQLKINLSDQAIEQLVLRTQGESAAAIEAAARQAVYIADNEDRDPAASDLEKAVHLMVYGTVREDLTLARQEKWAVACHEAGHALAVHYLFPGRRIDYISIQPRTDSLGFVAHRDDSSNARGGLSMTRAEIEADVTVALSGREAERLMLGEKGMSAGAGHDRHRANVLIRNAVLVWGLDDQLGPMAVTAADLSSDPALAALCTARRREWLKGCEHRAKSLLQTHEAELKSLAERLYHRESLEHEEIEKILPRVGEGL